MKLVAGKVISVVTIMLIMEIISIFLITIHFTTKHRTIELSEGETNAATNNHMDEKLAISPFAQMICSAFVYKQTAKRTTKVMNNLHKKCSHCDGRGIVEDNAKIGQLFQAKRVKAKITLRQMSEKMGLSIGYISDMERGRKNFSLSRRVIYDRSINEIITG